MAYSNQVEHELKNSVFDDFFNQGKTSPVRWTQERDRIDFTLYNEKTGQILLWAEAKKNLANPYTMLTQLILTLKKSLDGGILPPPYLACFDSEMMTFVEYSTVMHLFALNDFNWSITPSNHKDTEFIKAEQKVTEAIGDRFEAYNFTYNKDELKYFIKNTLVKGTGEQAKIAITKSNFDRVYQKWVIEVKPSIALNWDNIKKQGLMDADFYLADLLSLENKTLVEKLFVLLQNDHYVLDRKIDADGFENFKNASFNDGQKAHNNFWKHYERPPKEEYQQDIKDRRELLLPADYRERKGSFFTPQIWVEKSQNYLAKTLGENWGDDYVVWDCAAGTGNLLVGLPQTPRNIFASTLDQADVAVMHQAIADGKSKLFSNQVFRFDFLNPLAGSGWDGVPGKLKEILEDPEKRKKLVIYINPPYAEAGTTATRSGTGQNKDKVAFHKIKEDYTSRIGGEATNELFALFLARIKGELNGCVIGEFSTLKHLMGGNFEKFRQFFKAKLLDCFLMPANTFDNVDGNFPIGFKIWDTGQEEVFKEAVVDVYNKEGDRITPKNLVSLNGFKSCSSWISSYKKQVDQKELLAWMNTGRNDFQNQQVIYIEMKARDPGHSIGLSPYNLTPSCVYFAVRKVIPHTTWNHNDQFLYPQDGWQSDTAFQTNCLVYTLFHDKNNIKSTDGINHFIPFTEEELGIKQEPFTSHFMTDFIAGSRGQKENSLIPGACFLIPSTPITFTPEAVAVLEAGKTLFQYYHSQAKNQKNYIVNASFYDIKAHFKGRTPSGRMNTKSTDEEFNRLHNTLKGTMKLLAKQIEPKVWQYKFLI